MTRCTIVLDHGVTIRHVRDDAGRRLVEIGAPPMPILAEGPGPGLGHALALLVTGALAAGVCWTAVIFWMF